MVVFCYLRGFSPLISAFVAGVMLIAYPPPATVLSVSDVLLVTMPFFIVYTCGLVL